MFFALNLLLKHVLFKILLMFSITEEIVRWDVLGAMSQRTQL